MTVARTGRSPCRARTTRRAAASSAATRTMTRQKSSRPRTRTKWRITTSRDASKCTWNRMRAESWRSSTASTAIMIRQTSPRTSFAVAWQTTQCRAGLKMESQTALVTVWCRGPTTGCLVGEEAALKIQVCASFWTFTSKKIKIFGVCWKLWFLFSKFVRKKLIFWAFFQKMMWKIFLVKKLQSFKKKICFLKNIFVLKKMLFKILISVKFLNFCFKNFKFYFNVKKGLKASTFFKKNYRYFWKIKKTVKLFIHRRSSKSTRHDARPVPKVQRHRPRSLQVQAQRLLHPRHRQEQSLCARRSLEEANKKTDWGTIKANSSTARRLPDSLRELCKFGVWEVARELRECKGSSKAGESFEQAVVEGRHQ